MRGITIDRTSTPAAKTTRIDKGQRYIRSVPPPRPGVVVTVGLASINTRVHVAVGSIATEVAV